MRLCVVRGKPYLLTQYSVNQHFIYNNSLTHTHTHGDGTWLKVEEGDTEHVLMIHVHCEKNMLL